MINRALNQKTGRHTTALNTISNRSFRGIPDLYGSL